MKKKLLELLQTLNTNEQKTYFAYIKNKFKKPNKIKNSVININALVEMFDTDFILNTIFKNIKSFNFNNKKMIEIKNYETETGTIILIEIKNNDKFNEFLKKVLKTSNTNQGACLIFNKMIDIIIISNKPYSNVNEHFFKLNKKTWINLSKKIRIEHEIAHYYTKNLYGHAANNLHDELIADFIAFFHTMKQFKASWFIKFISNKNKSKLCRFDIYTNQLPNKVKAATFLTAQICAQFIETWSKTGSCTNKNKLEQIIFLCELGLENMIKLT